MASNDRMRATLKSVAVFEALKGLAALGGLLGLLGLMHHDLHRLALELIGHFGLDPAAHYPALMLQAVDRLNATPLRTLELLGAAYVITRWTEAWGLWHDHAWGEWFGALSGGVYIPFELRHLAHKPSWQAALVVLLNAALVTVLLLRLRQRARTAGRSATG